MPVITSDELGIAFDMHGCPNRCRHCWLGPAGNTQMSADEVRGAVGRFRDFISSDGNHTPVRRLVVASWVWEPDYADDYRQLHELEAQLSDGEPPRYELLSVWRLARDPDYAAWAKQVGPDTCQISFFGMEQTNDWFHRRKGAFADALTATQRLLDVGMKPRWQLLLTRKLIDELPELLKLVDRLQLRRRVEALGGQFDIFMHTPGPDGEGRRIEHLRPTADEVKHLPADIIESSRKHLDLEDLWLTEGDIVTRILEADETHPYAYVYPDRLWFVVKANWDVFTNVGTLEPWWRLGNLHRDSVAELIRRFETNAPPGLQTIYTHSPKKLAAQFGDPTGARIYTNADDLLGLYLAQHCQIALSPS